MLIGSSPSLAAIQVIALVADEAEMFLPKMEERERGAPFLLGRVMADRFIHFAFQFGRNAGRHRRLHR